MKCLENCTKSLKSEMALTKIKHTQIGLDEKHLMHNNFVF